MLEVFAIYQLCKTNKKNVLAKGRKPGGYTALTIVLWFGLEILGAVIGLASGMEQGGYILGLLFACLGGAISYAIAKNVSPLDNPISVERMQYGQPNPLLRPMNAQPTPQVPAYAQNIPTSGFCVKCGGRLPQESKFCPFCGNTLPEQQISVSSANNRQEIPVVPTTIQKNTFYVFAVQGPAFGMATGDIVLEKARSLKTEYKPAAEMEFKLIRPSMWNARVQNSNNSGMISVSYSIDSFKGEIRKYLASEKVPSDSIDNGLRLSEENSLQLTNPMSGVFVMGIPIYYPAAETTLQQEQIASAAFEAINPTKELIKPEHTPAAASHSECSHQFRHFICTKCGEKAPKPQLISEGSRMYNQYTYEYYRASSAEEARYFLEMTEVTLPLYYVMVHTPEGTWGRDKDGIFLESLCDFQRNLSLAQCEANTALFPQRLQDIQMAANKITDNYILSVSCGYCGYEWLDGVAYRAKTVVKCPECGRYNLADTEHVRFNNL